MQIILFFTLALFLVIRLMLSLGPFLQLAAPGDALQYLGPALLGSVSNEIASLEKIPLAVHLASDPWVWLDRITLANGLRLTSLLGIQPDLVAPAYATIISTSTMLCAMLWLGRQYSLFAAVLFGVLFNSCFLIQDIGGQILPEPTLVLWALLALISLTPTVQTTNTRVLSSPFFIGGIFSAFALLSKVTGLAGTTVFRHNTLAQCS